MYIVIGTQQIKYLQCTNSCALETQISFEVLCDFSHQTLEGQLADEQFC